MFVLFYISKCAGFEQCQFTIKPIIGSHPHSKDKYRTIVVDNALGFGNEIKAVFYSTFNTPEPEFLNV
jgi:hypothetical protein